MSGETKAIPILVSIICGPQGWDPETGHVRLMSQWWRWFMKWVSTYDPTKVAVVVDIEREVQVAHARSLAIRRAKIDKPEFAIQLDTDVCVENPIHQMVEFLVDDRNQGYGIITSPGQSAEGIYEVSFKPGESKYSYTEPFPIDKSWGGFLAFTRRAFLNMPAIGYVHSIANEKIDTYCQSIPYQSCPHCGKMIEGRGEDIDLIRQGQKGGAEECADPRIWTTHLKIHALKSMRPGLIIRNPEAEAKQ